uniref:Lipid desaturase domain-containing protein n=1 Tax=Araucaria cunninghamii TaxID=56994 RepID=A0A0D6QUI5_ARACU
MPAIGNTKFNICTRQMGLSRPSQKVGASFHFIKSPHLKHIPICKFSIVLKPNAVKRIQFSYSTKITVSVRGLYQPFGNHPTCPIFLPTNALNQHKRSSTKALVISNGGQAEMGLLDTSLESTSTHRLWVTMVCGAMVAMAVKSAMAMDSVESVLAGLVATYLGYVFADLGTGIYHWGIDNYGDASTRIFGSQIDAFQGHHKRPWTISRRQFANNIHALARPATFVLGLFLLLPENVVVDSFVGVATGCIVFSQQFHCWAHCKKGELPALVIQLQEMGVLVSRKMHGAHHRPPYDNNYCIVSGMWNPLLDGTKFFRKLEMFIYYKWGVRPRCWDETAAEWLQDGSYFADGSNELL